MLRGGAYKPRTSPVRFQGLGAGGPAPAGRGQGADRAADRHRADGRARPRAVLEVADVHPDRRAQHAELLAAGGDRPLGRARCCSSAACRATLEELLMAAEYILKEGNEDVILCERGIRTFETAYRFTLDIMAVPVLKELSHLPVIVDPEPRGRASRPRAAAVAGGRRGGRGRDHRRGPPRPRDADLRRAPGAAAGRASPRTWSRCSAAAAVAGNGRLRRRSDAIAVLGVGLIGGSIGLAARARLGARRSRVRPGPRALERALERGAIDSACRDRRRGARRRRRLSSCARRSACSPTPSATALAQAPRTAS